MNASRFISRRLRFEGKIAVISIAISFLVMILAVAISGGFRKELRDGISAISGDIQLTAPDLNYVGETDPISTTQPWRDVVEQQDGVQDIVPAVYRAGIVRSGDNIHGVLFKGVPSGPDSLGVRVPSRLARMLGLSEGDRLLAYFVGERVKVRNFHVTDIYPSILSGDDNLVVFAGLQDMQRLNGWSEEEVSALEIGLTDKSNAALEEMTDRIGTIVLLSTPQEEEAVLATSALNKYPSVFSWLDLIDQNVVMILVLMTIVAGFNMISGLLILLFRNISTIGTLKSLGMTDRAIRERTGPAVLPDPGNHPSDPTQPGELFRLLRTGAHPAADDPRSRRRRLRRHHAPAPDPLPVHLAGRSGEDRPRPVIISSWSSGRPGAPVQPPYPSRSLRTGPSSAGISSPA